MTWDQFKAAGRRAVQEGPVMGTTASQANITGERLSWSSSHSSMAISGGWWAVEQRS
jgi:hypothetical protein